MQTKPIIRVRDEPRSHEIAKRMAAATGRTFSITRGMHAGRPIFGIAPQATPTESLRKLYQRVAKDIARVIE